MAARYAAAGRLVFDTSRPGGAVGVIRAESDEMADHIAAALNGSLLPHDDTPRKSAPLPHTHTEPLAAALNAAEAKPAPKPRPRRGSANA